MKRLLQSWHHGLANPVVFFFLSLCLCVSVVHSSSAGDWTHWRGPFQNGFSPETNLPERWSTDGENLIWKAPVGGRTTPIILHGRVYLINAVGQGGNEQERVMCLDANTGNVLWEYKFNVFLTDIVRDRLGWTTMCGDLETGNVYAHGTQGLLFCFDKDGKVLWSHSMTEEYGRISGYGGRVTSPIIDGDLLILGIVNASWGEYARGGNRFVAMDKKTGAIRWWSETGGQVKDTYYSIPIVTVINNQRLLISGGADGGVHAFQVATGKHVWSYFFGTAAVNCSPVVDGNLVYIGHGEENPEGTQLGRVVCLDASQISDGQPKLLWKRDGLKIKYASPVIHEGRLYVADESADLFCLDAKTGKTIWRFKYGRNAKGSPVLADGKLYVAEVNGKFHILQPGAKNCKRLHVEEFDSVTGEFDVLINGSPAVANGRIYFMTAEQMYCIGKKDSKTDADSAGPKTAQVKPPDNPQPAQLQIVPADVTLAPGQSVKLTAMLYDANGYYLGEAKPQWSLAAMTPPPPAPNAPPAPKDAPAPPAPPVLKGTISENGELSVDKTPGQFGNVVAKISGLTARCRVRVAPRLPYEQDFSKVPVQRTPAGWVNAMGKFAVQELEGKKVLAKLANSASPLVARAHAYIGEPSLTDYTIESDVLSTEAAKKMPDMGVLANRYTLVLDGNKQLARLYSWDAVSHVERNLRFSWKPNVWYRFKLTVTVEGDKALVRGKIWEANSSEPSDWTLALEDPAGNKEGSPALYANVMDTVLAGQKTQVLFANVRVTPNSKGRSR